MSGAGKALLGVWLIVTGALLGAGEVRGGNYDRNGVPVGLTPFDSRYERIETYLEFEEASSSVDSGTRREPAAPRGIAVLKRLLKTASRFRYIAEPENPEDSSYGSPLHRAPGKERRSDHWQLPEETERIGGGDCEDKAIWLYARLLEVGFENVRLVVGKYRTAASEYHAWVVIRLDGKTYLLDPTINEGLWQVGVYPQGFYQPLYSYSRDGRWRHTRGYLQLLLNARPSAPSFSPTPVDPSGSR